MSSLLEALKSSGLVKQEVIVAPKSSFELESERIAEFNSYVASMDDFNKFNSLNPKGIVNGNSYKLHDVLPRDISKVEISTGSLFGTLGFDFTQNIPGVIVASRTSLMTLAAFNTVYEAALNREAWINLAYGFSSQKEGNRHLVVKIVDLENIF